MPFSRSRSVESMTRSATSSLTRKAPDWRSMASTSVVFPWSTWAMMATFRISARCIGLICFGGWARRVQPAWRDFQSTGSAPPPGFMPVGGAFPQRGAGLVGCDGRACDGTVATSGPGLARRLAAEEAEPAARVFRAPVVFFHPPAD